MPLRIDLHVHTRAHSPCSQIDPEALVRQAVRAGLDGLVITEHMYQWTPNEVAGLLARSSEPHFLLLTGFEYWSRQGDILIYGLTAPQAAQFVQGMPPGEAVRKAHALGGICIAAHPTRASMGFDHDIGTIGLDAIEVRSGNLQEHEQRLAALLASRIGVSPVAASDAHRINDVGRYVTEFDYPVQSMSDLQEAFRSGRFGISS